MSQKIWTRVIRPGAGGHPRTGVVQLRKGAEVLDALMDPTGAVVLTYRAQAADAVEDRVMFVYENGAAIVGGDFVRTVRHPGSGDLWHIFVARADESSAGGDGGSR